MAEQAAKEPTMEEILASIRRIISEGGEDEGDAVEAVSAEAAPEENTFETGADDAFDVSELLSEEKSAPDEAANESDHLLSVDELLSDNDLDFGDLDELGDLETIDLTADIETKAEAAAEILSEDIATEPQVELDDAFMDTAAADFDDLLDETADLEPAAPEPVYVPEPIPTPTPETPMAESNVASIAPAATALGTTGAGNALEGLVSELMKPMIKEWIDTNLPTIVERRVEAEVQQIAAKVVKALRD